MAYSFFVCLFSNVDRHDVEDTDLLFGISKPLLEYYFHDFIEICDKNLKGRYT